MTHSKTAALAALLGLGLAACSGANGNSITPGTPTAPAQTLSSGADALPAAAGSESPDGKKQTANTTLAIGGVNALGQPVKTFGDNSSDSRNGDRKGDRADARGPGNGTCVAGVEFFVPDKAGTPNSSETIDFYDAACTHIARDAVRVWTAGTVPTSEQMVRTVTEYAPNSTSPSSVRTATSTYNNATFGKYGWPIPADGFQQISSAQLVIGTQKTVLSNTESIMEPSTNDVNAYCMDSAGYNATGFAKTNTTYGWQGGALSGATRTQNADGSVTWTATHSGITETSTIGGLSIVSGTNNTACPIATPAYTLAGGTQKGVYTIPISATFDKGQLTNLTVTNATLGSGNTLNVVTNAGTWPANTGYITGTIASNGTTIATFSVNAFGTGTLTITATGTQYPIAYWNVVR